MKIYCPRCGQEQISTETRFCSRCGFLMSGLAEVVFNGGMPQILDETSIKPATPRRKGLKQGGGLFLLGVIIVPILAFLHELFRFPDEIAGIAAVLFFVGGIVRMIYALIFESSNPAEKTLEENVVRVTQKLLNRKKTVGELPASQSIPVDTYAPPRQTNWRDTNDLTPTSVTDNTTKLLSKDE